MPFSSILLAAAVAAYGIIQYTFTIQALRDLRRRPRVRGGSRTAWGLVIMCIPIFGALIYSIMGPTSFRQQSAMPYVEREEVDPFFRYTTELPETRPANVTPLRPVASSTISGRNPATRSGLTRSRAHNVTSTRSNARRPGA